MLFAEGIEPPHAGSRIARPDWATANEITTFFFLSEYEQPVVKNVSDFMKKCLRRYEVVLAASVIVPVWVIVFSLLKVCW